MSEYTTQVRFICEEAIGLTESVGYDKVELVIKSAIPKIFDFDFPIFDEAYRNVLCSKILRHYYTREIGAETVGLWKLWLNTKLNEIMPYYNQLYESTLLKFNPLQDTDYKRTYKKTGDDTRNTSGKSETSDEGTGNSVSREMFSDTPQGALDNVENETYLTNATKSTNEGTSKSNGKRNYDEENRINSTEQYTESIVGKSAGGSYAKMLEEFRKTLLNIDVQIIDDLGDLFMNLW